MLLYIDINGQAKVGIAGTAITKATPGEFDLSFKGLQMM